MSTRALDFSILVVLAQALGLTGELIGLLKNRSIIVRCYPMTGG